MLTNRGSFTDMYVPILLYYIISFALDLLLTTFSSIPGWDTVEIKTLKWTI